MRILKMNLVATLLLTILSCKNNTPTHEAKEHHKESAHTEQQKESAIKFESEEMAEVFQHYIHIKTALVNSDAYEAIKGANMLSKEAKNKEIKTIADIISKNTDIEVQRKAFTELSAQVESIVKGSLSSGAVYKQYCPMAFNNTGAYWLSKEKEIRNPYFGDRMLKCGSVKETIQ